MVGRLRCWRAGNLAVQYAKKVFGAKVIAVDINDDKLQLAAETGADVTINGREVEDVPAKVREVTDGGAQAAVVTAVSRIAFNQAVESVRAGGSVVACGSSAREDGLSITRSFLTVFACSARWLAPSGSCRSVPVRAQTG